MPQCHVDALKLRQVKLAHLRLVGNRQRFIQRSRIQFRLTDRFQHLPRQDRLEISDANSFAVQLLQEAFSLLGQESPFDRALQPGELLRLLNLDGSLLECHCQLPTVRSLERETGIEPATNSLEGCDSTTELLPPLTALSFSRQLNLSG